MNTYTSTILALAPISASIAGCNSSSTSDPVVNVDGSNAEMNEAMDTARRSFDQFLSNWKTMPNDGVSIKFAIPTDDDELEHIWFKPTEITETEITATCGNAQLMSQVSNLVTQGHSHVQS